MQFAEEHGVKFMETSAKTGYNIEDVSTCIYKSLKILDNLL